MRASSASSLFGFGFKRSVLQGVLQFGLAGVYELLEFDLEKLKALSLDLWSLVSLRTLSASRWEHMWQAAVSAWRNFP